MLLQKLVKRGREHTEKTFPTMHKIMMYKTALKKEQILNDGF